MSTKDSNTAYSSSPPNIESTTSTPFNLSLSRLIPYPSSPTSQQQQRQISALAALLLVLIQAGQQQTRPQPLPLESTEEPQSPPDQLPVFTHADEHLLVRKLHEAENTSSYFEVIEKLDKINGHSSSQWTSFYLKNAKMLNTLVSKYEPEQEDEESGPKASPPRSGSTPTVFRRPKQNTAKHRKPNPTYKVTAKTMSSNLDDRHSPTPPRHFIRCPGAQECYKYTDEDVTYFRKVLTRMMEENPHRRPTALQIGMQLEKRTRHTAEAWRWWLSKHKHEVDRIVNTYLRSSGSASRGTGSPEEDAHTRGHSSDYFALRKDANPPKVVAQHTDSSRGTVSRQELHPKRNSFSRRESRPKQNTIKDRKAKPTHKVTKTMTSEPSSSRSPTPPRRSSPNPSRNRKGCYRYTDGDIAYFRKVLSQMMQEDPCQRPNIRQLTKILGKKTRHTAEAWRRWIHRHKDEVDNIIDPYLWPSSNSKSSEEGRSVEVEAQNYDNILDSPSIPDDTSSSMTVAYPCMTMSRDLDSKGDTLRGGLTRPAPKMVSLALNGRQPPTSPRHFVWDERYYQYTGADISYFREVLTRVMEENPHERPNFLQLATILEKNTRHTRESWENWFNHHKDEVDDIVNTYLWPSSNDASDKESIEENPPRSTAHLYSSLPPATSHPDLPSTQNKVRYRMANRTPEVVETVSVELNSRRSPTPPTHFVPAISGMKGHYQYTEEDIAYFQKVLTRIMEENPDEYPHLGQVATLLAKKTRHSFNSWRWWLWKHRDEVEEIVNPYLWSSNSSDEETELTGEENRDWDSSSGPLSSMDEDDEDDDDVSLSSSESEFELLFQDRMALASPSNRYSSREKRALAKFIAEFGLENFRMGHKQTILEKFQPMYSRHTLSAWVQFYGRNYKEIDRQVKTFMVRNKLRQAQIVCPSNEKKLFDREESRDHTSSLPSNDVQDNR